MPRVTLPTGAIFSYSLAPQNVVEIEVLEGGPVEQEDWFGPGPRARIALERGAGARSFDQAGKLTAIAEAAIELRYIDTRPLEPPDEPNGQAPE